MQTNKQIYSIRKHKLGVASLLLGATFILAEAKTAHAAEDTISTSTSESIPQSESVTDSQTADTVVQSDVSQPSSVASKPEAEGQQPKTETTPTPVEPVQLAAPENDGQPTKVTTTSVPQTLTVPPATVQNNQANNTPAPVSNNVTTQRNTMPSTNEIRVEKGNDVTNQVTITKSSIENPNQNQTVNPHNAERVTLKYEWTFNEAIQPNDYFDFTLSRNVDTYGISTIKKVPQIVDKNDNNKTIAYGQVQEQNRIRYYFTDYMKDKKDVNAELSLNLFIDPVTVPKSEKINVTSTLGSHVTQNDQINVKYLDGVKDYRNTTLNGRIDTLSKNDQTFTHYAYFKPSSTPISSVTLKGTMKNGANTENKVGTVDLYEYLGTAELPESVYADLSDTTLFKKVELDNTKKTINSNGYTMTLASPTDKTYVVRYTGHYNGDAAQLTFSTNATGQYQHNYFPYYYPYSFNLTWDNGVAFYSNTDRVGE